MIVGIQAKAEVKVEGESDDYHLNLGILITMAELSVRLCRKMGREEHILKSVSTKDNLITSGESIDGVKNLIPGVLGHETDEQVQTDDGLFTERFENGRREGIGMITLTLRRMNIRR